MPDQARAEWATRMSDLSIDCAAAAAEDTGKCIRKLWMLLTIAPQDDIVEGAEVPSPVRIQALLAAEAFECAVLEMVALSSKLYINRRPDDHPVAAVQLPNLDEHRCPGANVALALTGALAMSLFHAASRPRMHIVPPPPPPSLRPRTRPRN